MRAHPDAVVAGATTYRHTCPPWCVTHHGHLADEEDWVHMSAPHEVAGTTGRLCLTVRPDGTTERPVVLIDGEEFSLEEAAGRGHTLRHLTSATPAIRPQRPRSNLKAL